MSYTQTKDFLEYVNDKACTSMSVAEDTHCLSENPVPHNDLIEGDLSYPTQCIKDYFRAKDSSRGSNEQQYQMLLDWLEDDSPVKLFVMQSWLSFNFERTHKKRVYGIFVG